MALNVGEKTKKNTERKLNKATHVTENHKLKVHENGTKIKITECVPLPKGTTSCHNKNKQTVEGESEGGGFGDKAEERARTGRQIGGDDGRSADPEHS